MSKLSFRARALDHTKPMPILMPDEIPDIPDFASINRAVPQMPTGMEKEEESEHHLQRAISAQQAFGRAVDHVIPTPEVFIVDDKSYDLLYPSSYKIPRQLIQVPLPSFEQDNPEYDIDSEDEEWLNQMKPLLNISETKFEELIECLEKNSSVLKVIELNEAKALLRDVEESVKISVYDYWLNKKLTIQKSLIPVVKTEKKDGTSQNNPYIAFRRRTEKMQTRKNRKNDESSYEKMLKLKREFISLKSMMQMIKQRELFKFELMKTNVEIFEMRYKLQDWNGSIYSELYENLQMASNLTKELSNQRDKSRILRSDENVRRKRTKRTKTDINIHSKHGDSEYFLSDDENSSDIFLHPNSSQLHQQQISAEQDEADNPDGIFAFKRKKGVNYHAPIVDRYSGGWPWESAEEGGLEDQKFKYNLTALSYPPNYLIGYTRRRVGRGGRVIFDRIKKPSESMDDEEEEDINADDEDEFDDERIDYNLGTGYDSDVDLETATTIEFNARHFNDDDNIYSNQVLTTFSENSLLERDLYKYNESELSNYLETSNNQKESNGEFSALRHSSYRDETPPSSAAVSQLSHVIDSTTSSNKSSLTVESFVKNIDSTLCNSILSIISNGMNSTPTTSTTTPTTGVTGIKFQDDPHNNYVMLIKSEDNDRSPETNSKSMMLNNRNMPSNETDSSSVTTNNGTTDLSSGGGGVVYIIKSGDNSLKTTFLESTENIENQQPSTSSANSNSLSSTTSSYCKLNLNNNTNTSSTNTTQTNSNVSNSLQQQPTSQDVT